jgi:hypothetical protein
MKVRGSFRESRTSSIRTMSKALDTVTARHGAEVVYCDTDSAFVTPSRLAPEIARRFDLLS